MHSALVPPGALHHRVTAALANWQLDDAEELLAGVERDPSPYAAPDPDSGDVPPPPSIVNEYAVPYAPAGSELVMIRRGPPCP